MRCIAYAETIEQANAALTALRECDGWKASRTISRYWYESWMSCRHMWAYSYRQVSAASTVHKRWQAAAHKGPCLQIFHNEMDTNNFNEAMNRGLKQKFLSARQDRLLTSLLQVFDKEAIPFFEQNYIANNRR